VFVISGSVMLPLIFINNIKINNMKTKKETMKNIHLLPTDKPTRLQRCASSEWFDISKESLIDDRWKYQHIYITSNEEIKEGDWCILLENHYVNGGIGKYNTEKAIGYGLHNTEFFKKIILTTDQDLIKDSVQPIDDEFLEWFVKNPSCEKVEIESWQTKGEWDLDYKIIIPKEEPKQIKCYCGHTTYCDCSPLEEPKQETLEEAAEKYCLINNIPIDQMIVKTDRSCEFETPITMFIAGAKLQQEQDNKELAMWKLAVERQEARCKALHGVISDLQERMYSEEDLRSAYRWGTTVNHGTKEHFNELFEQFKKK
jgi:hypothetical protein